MRRLVILALIFGGSRALAQESPDPSPPAEPVPDAIQSAPVELAPAEEPAPPPPAMDEPETREPAPAPPETVESAERAECVPEIAALEEDARGFDIGVSGYVTTGFTVMTPGRFFGVETKNDTSANPYVGRNDGFFLGDARLNVRASWRNLIVRLSLDGSNVAYEDDLDPIGRLSLVFGDAYFGYEVAPWLRAYVGRFRPPFDMEALTASRDRAFVHRALPSRGVRRHEGFAGDVPGFAPSREVGIMLQGPQAIRAGDVDIGYAVAVTNGNGGTFALNDNDLPAVWARLTLGILRDRSVQEDEQGPASFLPTTGIHVGLAGYWNETTTGDLPNEYRDRVFGAALELAARLYLADLRAQMLWSQTDHLLRRGAQSENSLGGHVQLGLWIGGTGLFPAYRYAIYNPRYVAGPNRLTDTADYDQVQHHTVGVSYHMGDLPLVAWLEFTRSIEQGGRAIPNDRVEGAVQVDFE